MKADKSVEVFFDLIKAGLWGGGNTDLRICGAPDWSKVYRLAQEQSVAGLVAAGIESVRDLKVPKADALNFAVYTMQVEQRNKAMNEFVAGLIERLRAEGVNAVLVKGQGIAQCYDRPLLRAAGDVDLLMDASDYEKAKTLLIPMATDVETEYSFFKHVGMTLNGWLVELHGTLQTRLSRRIDDEIDKVQDCVIRGGEYRVWRNGDTDVYLPSPDNDVVFVFTHILHHFFLEGVGLRQICDWCRLLWTYQSEVDLQKLESRIAAMGVMSEWRAFAAVAVDWLGMPKDAMPLYSTEPRWRRKAKRIVADVLKAGNFGHNKMQTPDKQQPYLVHKFISFWKRLKDLLRHFLVFPLDSVKFFAQIFRSGLYAILHHE